MPMTWQSLTARPYSLETVEGGLHKRGDLAGWCNLKPAFKAPGSSA